MSGNVMERGAWWQGTPCSAWWRVRSEAERIVFSCTLSAGTNAQPFQASINVVLCWFKRGRCFCMIPCTANSTRVPETLFCSFLASFVLLLHGFASLNLAHSFVIRSECLFREGCPKELAHSPSYSPASVGLGRVLSLLTARPLEYYRSDLNCCARTKSIHI